ncbi:hypothetical protein BDF14DRAFT_1769976 [Spinellus fusiger]|nr:hypothetical protein BDF14DRAFT_1769976 [Spinellus fusiger]
MRSGGVGVRVRRDGGGGSFPTRIPRPIVGRLGRSMFGSRGASVGAIVSGAVGAVVSGASAAPVGGASAAPVCGRRGYITLCGSSASWREVSSLGSSIFGPGEEFNCSTPKTPSFSSSPPPPSPAPFSPAPSSPPYSPNFFPSLPSFPSFFGILRAIMP